MSLVASAIATGIGATLLMDLWGFALKRAFGVRSLDYAMVGRWIGHMPRGRFVQPNIGAAPRVASERVIGWLAHYVIGIIFAALFLLAWGEDWLDHPSPLPAIAAGVLTVAAPFFVMQPCLGLGVAASKTPKPGVARLRSVATHAVFGLGLYAAALGAWALRMHA